MTMDCISLLFVSILLVFVSGVNHQCLSSSCQFSGRGGDFIVATKMVSELLVDCALLPAQCKPTNGRLKVVSGAQKTTIKCGNDASCEQLDLHFGVQDNPPSGFTREQFRGIEQLVVLTCTFVASCHHITINARGDSVTRLILKLDGTGKDGFQFNTVNAYHTTLTLYCDSIESCKDSVINCYGGSCICQGIACHQVRINQIPVGVTTSRTTTTSSGGSGSSTTSSSTTTTTTTTTSSSLSTIDLNRFSPSPTKFGQVISTQSSFPPNPDGQSGCPRTSPNNRLTCCYTMKPPKSKCGWLDSIYPRNYNTNGVVSCLNDYGCCLCQEINCLNCADVVCSGRHSCVDGRIRAEIKDERFYIACNGITSCRGAIVTIIINDINIRKILGIHCIGAKSCENLQLEIKTSPNHPGVKIEAIKCKGTSSCNGARFILNNVDNDISECRRKGFVNVAPQFDCSFLQCKSGACKNIVICDPTKETCPQTGSDFFVEPIAQKANSTKFVVSYFTFVLCLIGFLFVF